MKAKNIHTAINENRPYSLKAYMEARKNGATLIEAIAVASYVKMAAFKAGFLTN